MHIKVIERQHLPSRLWEKIELSTDFLTAIKQINEQLQYWPKFTRESVKERYTKIFQYLVRRAKYRKSVK